MRIAMKTWFGVCLVIGVATQFAAAGVLTVGQSGADYTNLASAVAAVTETNSTIRFIDSATYNESSLIAITSSLHDGLTIESAVGQKATVNFTDAGSYCMSITRPNITIQNVGIVNNARSVGVQAYSAATMTVTNVNFVCAFESATSYLLGPGANADISYSTFRGFAPGSTGAAGIYVSFPAEETPVTVDHCSFDSLGFAPIHDYRGGTITVTNSLFGNFRNGSTYRRAIYVAGVLSEDYNVYYEENALAWDEAGYALTDGPHTMKVAGYSDTFVGDTAAGNWEAAAPLYYAASDGTTIGAWQVPEPATMTLLVIGSAVTLMRYRRHL